MAAGGEVNITVNKSVWCLCLSHVVLLLLSCAALAPALSQQRMFTVCGVSVSVLVLLLAWCWSIPVLCVCSECAVLCVMCCVVCHHLSSVSGELCVGVYITHRLCNTSNTTAV